MSQRERRLAVVAGGAVGLLLLYMIIMPAFTYVQGLDMQIESLEEQVYNNTYQAAMSEVVSKRYGELASQHSTGWTEAEINDGLQRELDRLSMNKPVPGVTGADAKLLSITYRPEGQLTTFAGYREYQTTFTTQPSSIAAIGEFVRRIQESPQTLRIDKLDLRRENPSAPLVTAQITVTRTVVDAKEGSSPEASEAPKDAPAPKAAASPAPPAPMGGNAARNGSFEMWEPDKSTFPMWEVLNGSFALDTAHAVDGKKAAKVVCAQDKASAFQVQSLVAGQKYRLSFLAATSNEASFDVFNRTTGKPLIAAQPLKADGNMYEYALGEFVVPGAPGEAVELEAPRITVSGKDSAVYIDKVVLEAVKK